MAKNWKASDIVSVVTGSNTSDKMDLGRRFPLAFGLVSTIVGMCRDNGEALGTLLGTAPDYLTVRKIESVLKGETTETADDVDDEQVEEVEVKPEKPAKAAKAAKATKKSTKELYDECKAAGLKVKPKMDAEYYEEALKKAAAEAAKAAEEAKDDDDEEEEVKPVKQTKASKSKTKPAPKPVEEEEDDDWDI